MWGETQAGEFARGETTVIHNCPLPPRDGRHRVRKMDLSIFCPETYGMLRIVIQVLGSRVFTFFEKITKNRPQPVKPKNHRNELKFMITQSNLREGA